MPQASRLFAFTSWVLKAATVICAGITAILVLCLGALLLAGIGMFHIPIPADVLKGADMREVLVAAAMVIMAAGVVMALVALVLVLITRIVASAMAGDPFVVKNAARLNGIGLLLLAIQGVGLITGIAISAFPAPISKDLNFGFDVSLSGLFSAMLVFVLAQIFRHGSQMRDELDGTI